MRFGVYILLTMTALPLLGLDAADALGQFGRQNWQIGNGLPQNTVTSITQTTDGFIWIGTEEGLARFDGDRFRVYNTQNTPQMKSDYVQTLRIDREGALEVVSNAGVVRFEKGRFQDVATEPPSKDEALSESIQRLAKARVTSQVEDSGGVRWVGTDSGLMRVRNGAAERFAPNDPLATAAVLSLFEDRERNLWIGTDGQGLYVLRDQRFVTYTGDQIRCVYQDRRGILWFGTNGSGLRRFENGAVSAITTEDGLASNVILALAEDAKGSLLAGTPDGLNVINGSQISVLTAADGLVEDFVRSVYLDKDGSVWAGTRRGLSHMDGNRVTTYTQSNGLGSDLVGAITRDKRGDLWVATLRGLARMRNDAFVNYTVADGLPSNVITDLYADAEGDLWIGTQGGGLCRFRDDLFTVFGPRNGVPDTIFGVSEASNGNLWLAARNGIFRMIKRDLNSFASKGRTGLTVVGYGTGEGLRVSECTGGGHPAIWRDRSGGLWFATARGAAFLSREHSGAVRAAAPVVIESVAVDDASVDPGSLRDIEPGHARLSFEYAGLSFAAPQRVRYKYRLEGFDQDWINAGTRRVAYYTNLPPKRYVFRVTAQNGDGVWSNGSSSLAVRVLPHFYQTWWFDLLLLFAISAACYAIYAWRVRQVRAQFDAVLQERNRIAREIHDTLAQGFAGVSVQLELVSRLLATSAETARQHLDQARMLARACLADARRSIWDLRSQSPETEADFPARMSRLARDASEGNGVKIQLQVHGAYRAIQREIENELYRIGQEAVNNALRHAGARQIDIDVTFDTRKLRLTVKDDGRGFEAGAYPEGPNGHFGLRGMRERAAQIDAEFTVISSPGRGTEIRVEALAD